MWVDRLARTEARRRDAHVLCNICQSTEFEPGFQGRTTFGIAPTCARCGSSERHRIVFDLFSVITPIVSSWRVLQFAPDCSVKKEWFTKYVGSIYGGENSLNMMDTGLESGSYDLVLSNHVLEHVADDTGALREMLRIAGPKGVVTLTVPTPLFRWSTVDWHFADETKNYHYRDYGADFANKVVNDMRGLRVLLAIGRDPVTGITDHVNFLSYNTELLAQMAHVWQRKAVPLVNLHRS